MRKTALFVMAAILLIACASPALAAQSPDTLVPESTQLYPVVLTEEWKDMSRAERVAACQLSEEDVHDMSSESLLQYILNYPFMIDIYAFSTFEMGFEHVYNELSAISALIERDDYGKTLADTYRAIPVEENTVGRNSDCYQNIWELGVLEILIAQPEMTAPLTNEDLSSLAEIAENKSRLKSDALNVYSGSCVSFARALSEVAGSDLTSTLAYTIKTPAGTRVEVYNYANIDDWTSAEKNVLNEQMLEAYPTATLLRDASKKYNCHSYAWYSTSSTNHYWMDDPSAYMSDGSYSKSTRQIGDKAYWSHSVSGVPIHSGIVEEHMQSGAFVGARSKWGQLGVYNHRFDDCPYAGSISYWKRS